MSTDLRYFFEPDIDHAAVDEAKKRGKILNEPLCKDLITRFHREIRSGQSASKVLRELLHEVYSQGFAAAMGEQLNEQVKT